MPRVTSWWLYCVQDPALLLAGWQLDLASLALEELGVDVCGDRHALGWTGARDMVGAEGWRSQFYLGDLCLQKTFPPWWHMPLSCIPYCLLSSVVLASPCPYFLPLTECSSLPSVVPAPGRPCPLELLPLSVHTGRGLAEASSPFTTPAAPRSGAQDPLEGFSSF